MDRYVRFVLRYGRAIAVAILVLSGLAVFQVSQGTLGTSFGKLLLGESPGYLRFKDRIATFCNDNVIIFGIDTPDVSDPAFLHRLQAAVNPIEAHPEVASVQSVLSAQRILSDAGTLRVSTYAEEMDSHPEQRSALAREMLEDPTVSGYLASADGRAAAIAVELRFDESRAAEKGIPLVKELLGSFEAAGFDPTTIHKAGLMNTLTGIMDETLLAFNRIFPLAALGLLLSVWLLFRLFWPVWITFAVGGISALWTMGLAVLMDPNINVLMALVPSIILTYSFSDVIHLCSAYLLELRTGKPKGEAILAAARDVGRGCFWTSATTFAGFICLALTPTPVARQLGIVLAFGVAVALLLAVTLTPILFESMPAPRSWNVGRGWRVQSALDAFLRFAQRVCATRPVAVVLVFAALFVVSGVGVLGVHIDVDFSGRLSEDHPVRVDETWFEQRFSGTGSMDLFIDSPEAGGLLEPAFFASMCRFERKVEGIPGVGQVHSLCDAVLKVRRIMRPDDPPDTLPASREEIAQILLVLESGGQEEEGIGRLVDFDRRTARLLVQIPEIGVRETLAIGRAAAGVATPLVQAGAVVEPSGSMYLTGEWLDSIISGQKLGLLVSLVIITIMMAMTVSSLRAGIVSMVPNILPLLVLGGYVGFFWYPVDSDTLAIAMMAIGIGVDDTIHFLTRFRVECSRTTDRGEALRKTFHFTGRPIVITTLVLVLGFAPFAVSDYVPIFNMGTLLPMCFLVALAADILMVPAMAALGWFRFPALGDTKGTQTSAAHAQSTFAAPEAKRPLSILLVSPYDETYRHGRSSFRRNVSYHALTLPTLAALVPERLGAHIQLVDEGVEQLPPLDEIDLLGITCVTPSAPRAYELADQARRLGIPVVLGGPHPTLNPDEAASHADSVVIGFAEDTWPRLLSDLADTGRMQPVYRQEGRIDLSGRPLPRRDLLNLSRYLDVPVIQASRGCPNTCTFCSIPAMWGRDFHARPVADVVREIESIDSRRFLFLDPSLAENPRYALELFTALRPLKIRWGGLATIKLAQDPVLLKAAADCGCRGILVGFESISQESLSAIHKHFGNADTYLDAVNRFHDQGIAVLGTFVFGLDHEGPDVFERTAQFVDQARIDLVRYSVFTPFPGTSAFEKLDSEGRILTRDWNLYNTENVVFRPLHMTPEQLQEGLAAAWRHTTSLRSILHRVRFLEPLGLFAVGANLAFRFYARKAVRGETV